MYDNLVKAVVDIEKNLMAVDAGLHSDLEELLIEDSSLPKNLWGINLWPEESEDKFIEFDSMINLKPALGNRTRGVEKEYDAIIHDTLERFTQKAKSGETYSDIEKRMFKFFRDTNKKYTQKTILIVSHEVPLTLLLSKIQGLNHKQIFTINGNAVRIGTHCERTDIRRGVRIQNI